VAAEWKELDPDPFPFTRNVACQLRAHDDPAELLADVALIDASAITRAMRVSGAAIAW
jgi:hypothetical protein